MVRSPLIRQSRLQRGAALLGALRWLSLVAAVAYAPAASAQFNAQGRTKKPSSAQTSRSNPTPTKPGAKKPSAPGGEPNDAQRSAELLTRYQNLVLQQPGEEVPLVRLAELVRARDGNLQRLLDELNERALAGNESQRYAAYLALAFYASESGAMDQALAHIERALDLNPNLRVGYQIKGNLLLKRGETARAVELFQQALKGAEEPGRSSLLRKVRDLSIATGDIDAARSYHLQLTKNSKGNTFLEGELGRELLARGLVREAVSELERVVRAQQGDPRAKGPALLDLGEAELQSGSYDSSIAHLEQAEKLLHASPGKQLIVLRRLAEAHQRRGTLSQYLSELQGRAEDPQKLALLGQLHEQDGNTEQALVAYQRAAQAAPNDIDLKLRLARLLELTGDVERAVLLQREATRVLPRDVQLSLKLMNLLLAQGQRQAAMVEWDRSFSAAKADPEACLLLADFAERFQDLTRQELVLAELSNRSISEPRVLVDLGSRYYRKGDAAAARRIWDKILVVTPDKVRAQTQLAEVLINHEAFEDGLQLLKSAAERDPESSAVAKAWALGLERAAAITQGRKQKQWQEDAIEQYERVLRLPSAAPDKELARRHLVRLWKRRGDLPLRIEKLKSKLNKGKSDPDLLRLLVVAEEKLGNLPAAEGHLNEYVRRYPGDASALRELSQLQLQIGQFSSAMASYQKLIEADPSRSAEYYGAMSAAARRHGDMAAATNYARRALDHQPGDARSFALLGDLYFDQGQLTQAEDAFANALMHDESLDDVRLKLAELLTQTGQTEAAFGHLSHLLRTTKDDALLRRTANQLLPLSMTLKRTEEVENALRRLAISHTDTNVYKQMFFDVLATQLYPLELEINYGGPTPAKQAEQQLKAMATRSSVLLLSALAPGSSGTSTEDGHKAVALRLLPHDTSRSTQMALLAFAEGNHPAHQRTAALMSLSSSVTEEIEARLLDFLVGSGTTREVGLASAAVLKLQGRKRAVPALFQCLEQSSGDLAGFAALSLSSSPHVQGAERARLEQVLSSWLESARSSRSLRRAALIGLAESMDETSSRIAKVAPQHGEVARRFAEDSDETIAQSAFLLMHYLPDINHEQQLMARALLSTSEGKRGAAQLLATSRGAAPSMSAVHAGLRPSPDQLGLESYLDLFMESWLRQARATSQGEVPVELRPELLAVARTSLETSSANVPEVLRQLSPGGMLTPSRAQLSDLLLFVSISKSPWANQAVRLLRAEDGAATRNRLLDALRDARQRDDALDALTQGTSVASADVLEAFEREAHPTFGLKEKVRAAWVKLARSRDPQLREKAQRALTR